VTSFPRILPVGDAAFSVEWGDAIDAAINARVRALDTSLADAPCPGFVESVPTYRSLLVLFDPGAASASAVRESLLGRLDAAATDAAKRTAMASRLVTLPTRYGGDEGPDLDAVARATGLSEAEVVSLHGSREHTAFMLGFTPGFAYLGLLPEALRVPRRTTPRVRVPAGSVAIAGLQTGVYPAASPGGWSVIGRTALRLFDPRANPPALILPGDRVRFVSTEASAGPEPPRTPTTTLESAGDVEVVEGGLLTTVQDGGRVGYRRLGVSSAGPADAPSHRAANELVGNEANDAALECTLAGPTLRFRSAATFAITGADLGAVLERADLGTWEVPLGVRVLARPGNVLSFHGRRWGCRAYVALAGGIEVETVLGSRATDRTGGFGGVAGRALRSGDRLVLGKRVGRPTREHWRAPAPTTTATVRVILGPQAESFTPEALRLFGSESFAVTASSDRVGCRLAGPILGHRGPAEIVTDGMVPGSVQVPPDGQPIVMLADAPTTGGYPKVATVVSADLPLLAQLAPGEGAIRFAAVAWDEGL
jgi:KipI family sensor histidine kinase inhibitor